MSAFRVFSRLPHSNATFIQTPLVINLSLQCSRCIKTSTHRLKESPNKDYAVSQVYVNRNPRNLEKLALARKRLGWRFQSPRKDYYHKLVFSHTQKHTEAWIEHFTGEVVLIASTKEWAIKDQLYSANDVSASSNIGKILAQRCLESGLTSVFFDEAGVNKQAPRVATFLEQFKNANISLTEPKMVTPQFRPGIDYDNYNRYAEPKEWQEDYQKV
ncbi:unnamed protein product [Lymnaea stagnalis]|uniref:Large ribosomal subunit protein uL18m n=1 Tax=Lymnaea stagnalis TaxID=6523 RepID=A0AAV2I4B3_LYMST